MLTMDQKQQILHHYRVDRSSFMYKDSVLLGPFFVLTTMDRLGEVRIKELSCPDIGLPIIEQ